MKLKKKMQTIGIFALSCVLLLGMINCKKPDIPNGIITISNECGLAIDVFFNGVFQFSLEYENERSIEDLEVGTYEIEARRKGTGEFVFRETIYLMLNKIYVVHIWSSAIISIKNNYGETLSVYSDDNYFGDLDDQANAMIQNVPYGDHKIEAKTSDDTIVATKIISVLVDITYEWTINK